MRYRVNIIIHRAYEVEANSTNEAIDYGFEAFENDKAIIGNTYGELYCLDTLDEGGNIVDEHYYY